MYLFSVEGSEDFTGCCSLSPLLLGSAPSLWAERLGLAGTPRAGDTGLTWQWPWEDHPSALGPCSSLPFCFGRVVWASLGLASDPGGQEGGVCAVSFLQDWKVFATV